MLIRLLSDTHREFDRTWTPTHLDTDTDTILVLAGDIDVGKQVPMFVDSIAERFRAVVYVAGNHEMYNGNIEDIYDKLKATAHNAYMLQNDTVTIDDVEFVGATLWTDFNDFNPLAMWDAQNNMNDFLKIRHTTNYKRITPTRMLFENKASRDFLSETIDPNKKQVVVTHHCPTEAANTGDPYAGGKLSPCFYNTGMDQLVIDAGHWFFGHTHHCVDMDFHGTRIVSNCRGYPGEHPPGFVEEKTIEIA